MANINKTRKYTIIIEQLKQNKHIGNIIAIVFLFVFHSMRPHKRDPECWSMQQCLHRNPQALHPCQRDLPMTSATTRVFCASLSTGIGNNASHNNLESKQNTSYLNV